MTDLLPASTRTGRTAGSGPRSNVAAGNPGAAVRTRIVFDTSVLVADPSCLSAYPGCDLVIPLTVIEELDGLKTRMDDVGRAARAMLRTLEELRMAAGGSLAEPVPVDGPSALGDDAGAGGVSGGATLRIELNGVQTHVLVEHGLDTGKPDNRIIGAALGQAAGAPTRLLSNDAALRIKAAHLGLDAGEHRPTVGRPSRVYAGWTSLAAAHERIDCLYAAGAIAIDAVEGAEHLAENSFAVLRSGSQSALTRRSGEELVLLPSATPEAWGLRARSKEQRFALELLLDSSVSVVALDGRAGTGKTILAVAAGLEQVVEQGAYERLAIYRPLVPVGRADVGFLPGGLDEKLDPWMSAIYDSIVALTDRRSSRDAGALIDELTNRGTLSLESVTFLRGRSLHRQLVIVDEAQNLEPTTLKTILTRVGEDTKVVFTGDTTQIDAPYLSDTNNALAVLCQAFRNQPCFGHVTLTSCERSHTASLAAELL